MIGQFLRENKYAAGIWLVLRVYLGWSWLTAGWGKVTGDFNAGGYLQGSVANPVMSGEALVYPNYVAFLESIAIPNADLFSFVVAWGEVLVGLGLILGVFTSAAAFFGVVMNMSFLFAGTVSTNPWMILISMFIMAAGANAGRYGGDRWVLPYLKSVVFKGKNNQNRFGGANLKEAV
ncbi:D-tyrosyl-tRNA deacylase [Halalkalibacter wakoensis JCM 9140]|uniref:D-tyrosyl-tRNA deacylase n=1 Tax=Halalkalibacter wakoensis JCM 9140 TaxID=1236970 RepID=W4Q7A0_9BACI|nr:DoxX family protein [Halalkalibacter wakoensis]GAE27264.1 D-tyrosyl-tRNA deacylase [Halalkalibacter wakoensis JCM 9140]